MGLHTLPVHHIQSIAPVATGTHTSITFVIGGVGMGAHKDTGKPITNGIIQITGASGVQQCQNDAKDFLYFWDCFHDLKREMEVGESK